MSGPPPPPPLPSSFTSPSRAGSAPPPPPLPAFNPPSAGSPPAPPPLPPSLPSAKRPSVHVRAESAPAPPPLATTVVGTSAPPPPLPTASQSSPPPPPPGPPSSLAPAVASTIAPPPPSSPAPAPAPTAAPVAPTTTPSSPPPPAAAAAPTASSNSLAAPAAAKGHAYSQSTGSLPSMSSAAAEKAVAPSAAVVAQGTTAASRGELLLLFEKGRTEYTAAIAKLCPKGVKPNSPEERVAAIANRLWYRFAYLINARYQGGGSELSKDVMMVLTVLMEVRQCVIDVFEVCKMAGGDKVSKIVTQHAWVFSTAKSLEEMVARVALKLTQLEGNKRLQTSYIPQHLDGPLTLFEDRLANFSNPQQQDLFDQCNDLRSLRSQVEAYMQQQYEPAIVQLFLTEAVGKGIGILLPNKEKRKMFYSSLLAVYSAARANSWMLLRSNHNIDLSKMATKLNTNAGTKEPNAVTNKPESGDTVTPLVSVNAADMLRQNTASASSLLALPNAETLTFMNDGLIMTGFFQIPNAAEPIVAKMRVYYDLMVDESIKNGIAPPTPKEKAVESLKSAGRRGALFWVPEKEQKMRVSDMSLPVSDISDILLGKQTKVFQSLAASKCNPACCVSLVAKGGYNINFEASTKEVLAQWLTALTKLANATGKKLYEEGQQPENKPESTPASPQKDAAATTTPAPHTPQATTTAASTSLPPLLSSVNPTPAATPTSFTPVSAEPPLLSKSNSTGVEPPLLSASSAAATPTAATTASTPASTPAAAAPATPAALPHGGWVEAHTGDGKVYYYNSATGASVWDRPLEYDAPATTVPDVPYTTTPYRLSIS